MFTDPDNSTIASERWSLTSQLEFLRRDTYTPIATMATWQRPDAKLQYEALCRGDTYRVSQISGWSTG